MNERLIEDIFNPPKTHWWHYLYPWSLRRIRSMCCGAVAAIPGVRAHVLRTTALCDHPMYCYVAAPNDLKPVDHPDGCFFGTFGGYPEAWHIPAGSKCRLDHGEKPIQLERPAATQTPGSVYFDDENRCRFDGEIPTAEPTRAIAEPVLVTATPTHETGGAE